MAKAIITMITKTKTDYQEEDTIELMSEGEIYFKSQSAYIMYDETELTGMQGTKTSIKISPEQVDILRKGAINTQMIFCEGQSRFSHYETPQGPLNLEIFTFSINKEIDEVKGNVKLQINYQLNVNDSEQINNTINLCAKLA